MLGKLSSEPFTPTVDVDETSVVAAREITNATADSISVNINTESSPGACPPENAVGQAPKAHYTAHGGSVICADKISGVTVNGNIDLSVSLKTSEVRAGGESR